MINEQQNLNKNYKIKQTKVVEREKNLEPKVVMRRERKSRKEEI